MPLVLAKEVNNKTYIVELDPTDHYKEKGADIYDLLETLGLIPEFMFAPEYIDLPVWEALDAQYQHGGGLYVGSGTVTAEGTYQYPGDPDLFPLARYVRADEVIYQYPSGVMAIPKNGVLTPTRMD